MATLVIITLYNVHVFEHGPLANLIVFTLVAVNVCKQFRVLRRESSVVHISSTKHVCIVCTLVASASLSQIRVGSPLTVGHTHKHTHSPSVYM